MADKHFVVQGALCKCNFGNTINKIRVSGRDEYFNDAMGESKPVASTKDTGNPFMPGAFGYCSFTHSTCTPAVTKWNGAYPGITLSDEGNILTEESKAICAAAGSPCISIVDHGQVTTLTEGNANGKSTDTTSALNPLVTHPIRKENPVVQTISVCLEKRQAMVTFSSSRQRDNAVPSIRVRINEPLFFNVETYVNTVTIEESLVYWKIHNNHSMDQGALCFEANGPLLSYSFDTAGDYRVLAFGKDQTDSIPWLDFHVDNNSLKNEFVVNGENGQLVSSPAKPYKLKTGFPADIKAIYEIDPATTDEKARVFMQVTDQNNNIIATSNNDTICFTPANAGAVYSVLAVMYTDTYPQIISKKFHTENVGSISIINHESTHLVRPHTNMSFHVSASEHENPLPFSVATATQWLLNGKQVGIGTSITLDGDTHLTIPGKYTMEARINAPAATDELIEKAQWHFEVKHNEALQIIPPNGSTHWIVGKYYTLSLQTLMDYDERLDGPVIWNPYGATGSTLSNASAQQDGRFTITARLGKSKRSLEINATKATIDRWCFVDQALICKPSAGWQEYIHLLISSSAAANEKIPLHLLQVNPVNRIHYVKDLGTVNFNTTGELKLSINTRELKPLLTKVSFDWETFRLLFAIPETSGSIQFADMKAITVDGKKYWFPLQQSNKRMQEKGKSLQLNTSKAVVTVQFYNQHSQPAYKVYKYGEQLRMHIQTKNLSGEEVLFQIWENKYKTTDKCCLNGKIRLNEYETADVTIDTRRLKAGNIVEDSLLRYFYVALKSPSGNYYYPADIADKNLLSPDNISYFQHIKLSNRLDTLLNKRSRANAPVILGEPQDEDSTDTKCPRCNAALTTDQLIKIFPRASTALLQTVADTYNRFMERTGMNTCWNKAHFFAQVAIESGEYLRVKDGESFNWYWEDLATNFPPFRTADGRKKALQWGRAVRKPIHPGVTKEHQQNIANYVYSPESVKGKSLGNTEKEDGWNFRGRGLIQLTGRDAYTYANTFTGSENANIVLHPDLVATDMKIAVLSSMAFWHWKGLQHAANGNTEVTAKISKQVGKDAVSAGKSSHAEKKRFFDTNSSVLFRVKDCLHGKAPEGSINRYIIKVNAFNYQFVEQNTSSKQYKYDVYLFDTLVKTYVLERNENGLLPFPETGPNWGRYGARDGGDDNYVAPAIAAPLLGFFYSLSQNGYNGKLYFNDISASDKRNIGHKGHVEGNDIDIRYPGSTDRAGAVLWSEAKRAYKDEKEFVTVLEGILNTASRWGFRNNYAFKKSIKNTLGISTFYHQNHFHLGLREKQ